MDKEQQQQMLEEKQPEARTASLTPPFMRSFADEVAKLVIARLPKFQRPEPKKPTKKTKTRKEAMGGLFLDTSAMIDGRIFDVIGLQLISMIVITDGVLLELKHIADSKDPLKKARGRRGLEKLSSVKKIRGVKVIVLPGDKELEQKYKEVDEQLIQTAKMYRGKIVTCDYNLEKKAHVLGVAAINMHALAQMLKVAAVPGEQVNVSIVHAGKDKTQGVGYLDDGTMIVVEKGSDVLGQTITVVISRVIQTASGKILFAKKWQSP